MTAILKSDFDIDPESRWCSSIIGHKFDTTIAVRAEESRAIGELGIRNLRRLQYHDPTAPGWRVIGRLLRPVEAVNAGEDSPPTTHRRRAMADAIAVLLARCAEVGQTFRGWSTEEWIHLLGRDQGRVLPGTRPVGPATRSAPISPRTPICSVPSPSSTSSVASNESLCRGESLVATGSAVRSTGFVKCSPSGR